MLFHLINDRLHRSHQCQSAVSTQYLCQLPYRKIIPPGTVHHTLPSAFALVGLRDVQQWRVQIEL